MTTTLTSIVPYERPEVLNGHTEKIDSACGSVFCIFNIDNQQLKEIGIIKGKAGCCDNLLLRVISLLVSKLLQSGLPIEEIEGILQNQFEGNCGNNPIWVSGTMYHSCIDFIFKRILEDIKIYEEIKKEKETQNTQVSTPSA